MEAGGGVLMKAPADGFIGAVLAAESVLGVRALMHGPGGCRGQLSGLTNKLNHQNLPKGHIEYNIPYFYGRSRVPCTFVDERDYILGTAKKIDETIRVVSTRNDDLVVVINAPGAALIGDDHNTIIKDNGLSERFAVMEDSLISIELPEGFDMTMRSIVERLIECKDIQKRKNSVNVIGLTIVDKDWGSVVSEFRYLLSFIGIDVVCFVGAGCTVDEIRDSVNASCNIVFQSEFGFKTATYYEKEFGIPSIYGEEGAPVGFDSLNDWLISVALFFDKDPTPALDAIKEYRRRAYDVLMAARVYSMAAKGATFCIEGNPSIVCPLTKWLYNYLSMIPVSVRLDTDTGGKVSTELYLFLENIGFLESLESLPPKYCDVYLSDGNTAQLMKETGRCLVGIDIGTPSIVYDLIPRPIMGAQGAMYILDCIINGLCSK
jgi:nitrogenase molybdenum-iron protein alpha/beta subunit